MSIPIRKNVLAMEPYQPGKPVEEVKRELGLTHVVKLASNENPFGPSPKAVDAVKKATERMHIYPDGAAFELRKALSDHYKVSAENLILGNGSDELIHLLGLIMLGGEGDEMMMGDPGFSRYDASAHLTNCRLIKIPLDRELKHDLPAMARAATVRTKLIYIANPNNPTGTIVRRREVESFLDDLPDQVLVVLDEAYMEYCVGVDDFPTSLDYVRGGRNVVGLRTFSKAYGLAGIRVGFGFAPAAIVDAINRAREPFNVNSLAQVAAIAALDDTEHVSKTAKNNRAGLDRLARFFRDQGLHSFESYANFICVDLGRPAEPVFRELLAKGIITRSGNAFGMPNALRISIGKEQEMNEFVQVFQSITIPAGAR